MAVKGKMHMGTKVVEVTEFNSKVRCDLRGCLEAAMVSEAIKWLLVQYAHGYQSNQGCWFQI